MPCSRRYSEPSMISFTMPCQGFRIRPSAATTTHGQRDQGTLSAPTCLTQSAASGTRCLPQHWLRCGRLQLPSAIWAMTMQAACKAEQGHNVCQWPQQRRHLARCVLPCPSIALTASQGTRPCCRPLAGLHVPAASLQLAPCSQEQPSAAMAKGGSLPGKLLASARCGGASSAAAEACTCQRAACSLPVSRRFDYSSMLARPHVPASCL